MIQSYTVTAIIPARGGSKRVPRKNLKELCGKPLIAWTIEEAKKSAYLDRVIVSTDDEEIAALARSLGAEVPYTRPAEMSTDEARDYLVFEHALSWMEEHEGKTPDMLVQLRPTSPLRTVEHIDATIEALSEHPDADSARTVTEPEQSPYKMYSVDEEGYLQPLIALEGEEAFNKPTYLLPKAYKHVGYVDALWARTVTAFKGLSGKKIVPVILPHAENGIDTLERWSTYEYLMKTQGRA